MFLIRLLKLLRSSPYNFFRYIISRFTGLSFKIKYKGSLLKYNFDKSTLYHLIESFPKIEKQIELLPNEIDGVIIDGGANNGVFSFHFSKKYQNEIYAFEPSPKLGAIIEQNLKGGNVFLEPMAIGSETGEISFYNDPLSDQTGSTIEKNVTLFAHSNQRIEKTIVNSITLKDFKESKGIEKIGLLKLDIQGKEYDVLNSNPELLEHIDILMIEVFLKEDSAFELIDLIRKYYPNYVVTNQIAFGADFIFYKNGIKLS